MLNFFKKFFKTIIYGKEFEISKDELESLKEIKYLLDCLPSSIGKDARRLTGDEFKSVAGKLLPWHKWEQVGCPEKNLLLPPKVAKFFLEGCTLDKLDSYECVRDYGMLYGEKRRLVLI